MKLGRRLGFFASATLFLAATAPADVREVRIEERGPVLGGMEFGESGAYEKIRGTIVFGVDPLSPANDRIVDLALAPRNEDGLVEATANFLVLRPLDRSRGVDTALVEVSNRGGMAALSYFCHGHGSNDPTTEAHFGDGLLLRMGMTVVWVGWQWDVPGDATRLRLEVPIAVGPDGPITGLVRSDWVVEQPLEWLDLAHRDHRAYPVLDAADPSHWLSWRAGRDAARVTVDRSQYSFAARTPGGAAHWVHLDPSATPGRIYEAVYRAQDPRVVGLGLAAIRDVASYIENDEDCPFPASHSVAMGISQTGRFLRHFLYQGFNTDEAGRKVYDGVMAITAGAGRGSFNHRFAQPSRDAHRYSAFFYPTDLFPFTSRSLLDPVSGRTDGLFENGRDPDHLPRVFWINTGYEYWGRAASLLHTNPQGDCDVELLPNERLYHLAGGQHFEDRFPPSRRSTIEGSTAHVGNPAMLKTSYRALLRGLVSWSAEDVEPPESRYPRFDQGDLVDVEDLALPAIPGIRAPRAAHFAYRADYGPRFRSEGIVDFQPPRLGEAFPARVPQVDGMGNELGGLRGVELRVPLATYLPWSLRHGRPGEDHELADFRGTVAPLPRDANPDDPRPSVSELYPDRASYLERVDRAIEAMLAERVLLELDVDRVRSRAEQTWAWVTEN